MTKKRKRHKDLDALLADALLADQRRVKKRRRKPARDPDAVPKSALRRGAKGWYYRPPGRAANGKRHSEIYLGSHRALPTREAAETEARRRRDELRVAKLPPGAGLAFSAFAELYLHEHVANLRKGTARTQRSMIRTHLLPRFERLQLVEITRPTVQAWIWAMRDAGVPHSTARARVALLRAMLAEASRRGLACEVPSKLAWPVGDAAARAREDVTFTRAEALAVIEAAPWPWKAAFAIALYMGDRAGEILGLEWRDIDFDRARLYVRRQRQRGRVVATKTRDSAAAFAMPAELVAILEAFARECPIRSRYLFPSPRRDGQPVGDDALRRALKRACRAAGVEYKHGLHAFRRCFADTLSSAGATLPQISAALRHRQLATTLKYLSPADRADVEALIRAAASLDPARSRA